jgi:lysophospholipid acyltransferase (LPLAT)-like uncharacterized protein
MSREKLIAVLGSRIARLLFATLRMRVDDRADFITHPPPFPLIFTFWHNRILAITLARLRFYHASRKGVTVLTSPSRDGEILAELMAQFHMGAIRGSSSRRGSRALMECADILRNGGDIAVTPDGPRGPRYQLGPGLVLLAQTTGARIFPIHAKFSRSIELKTWDGFRIPLPFSRVDFRIGPYETIPETPTAAAFEAERSRIEQLLRAGAD